MNKGTIIKVPLEDFERLIEACCNQNNCIDNPEKCQCASSANFDLRGALGTVASK